MKQTIFLTSLLILFGLVIHAQTPVSSITFDSLQKKINVENHDSVYIVNFWATWCGPCIQELPNFVSSQDSLKDEKVKYIFVSLDFPGSESRVSKVFSAKGLNGEVILLNEPDANSWIDKIDPSWQGNIPATWFINKKEETSDFHIGTIETTEIIQKVNNLKKEK